MQDNLALWSKVEKTDPAYTKKFKKGGGFEGTATNATYLARRATETFGPMGIGWGITVVKDDYIQGAPEGTKIHVVHAKLWYKLGGERGEVEAFGQTEFCGKRNNGNWYTDEEAPKKSLTDAMTKALSMLGFAGDIHLGLYDDVKYVRDLKAEFAEQPANDKVERPVRQQAEAPAQEREGKALSYDEQVAWEERFKQKVSELESGSALAQFLTDSKVVWFLGGINADRRAELSAIADAQFKTIVSAIVDPKGVAELMTSDAVQALLETVGPERKKAIRDHATARLKALTPKKATEAA